MMDITRATLYFAKGVILVEGICEALLIPVLARRLCHDLASHHISVIPICGVAFETFKKILNPSVLGIPVAIVTDADPPVTRGDTWEDDTPTRSNGGLAVSERTAKLLGLFSQHPTVRVCPSKLTLEYDLAEAGNDNATIMAQVWEGCFAGNPNTFSRQRVVDAGSDRSARALAAWRGICRAEAAISKAEFAHRLAACLEGSHETCPAPTVFTVPLYIRDAIEHVHSTLASPPPTPTSNA
jgi:putative ATP-dependent endonuclease of OLD family